MTAAGGPPDAALELLGVGKEFGHGRIGRRAARSVTALADVTLTVPRGSRFGIVGESGSGKTTLVRLMAGLDRPTVGRIIVRGTDFASCSSKRLRTARTGLQMVFQDPAGSLNPRMRVAEIIAEPLAVARADDIRSRVVAAVQSVGLDRQALRRYPHQFSGGQRQRISIARALVSRPEILIADEAVSALDVTVRTQILDLIARAVDELGITLVFVSHDLSVIRRMCDRVAVLRAGRVVEQGRTDEIYARPRDHYTRGLLAAVPTFERAVQAARVRAGGSPDRGQDTPTS